MPVHDQETPAIEHPLRGRLKRRTYLYGAQFATSALFTVVLLAISFLTTLTEQWPSMLTMLPETWDNRTLTCCAAGIATLLLCVHAPLYMDCLLHLWRFRPSVSCLLSISTFAAYIYSLLSIGLTDPDIVPTVPTTYFAPMGTTLLFVALRNFLQTRTTQSLTEEFLATGAVPDELPSRPSMKSDALGHFAILMSTFSLFAGLFWTFYDAPAVGFTVFFTGLIAMCPCAVTLVEILNVRAVATIAAEHGIYIRNRKTLETATEITTLVTSKSALTTDQPTITDLYAEALLPPAFIGLAASAEAKSYHPIAHAIANRAIRDHIKQQRLAAYNEIPSHGVEVLVNGSPVRVGKQAWLQAEKIYISANLLTKADQLSERGKTVVFVSSGRTALGFLALLDTYHQEIPAWLRAIERLNIDAYLVSGGGRRAAKTIARELNIPLLKADADAGEKADCIRQLQTEGKRIGWLDTGRNDPQPTRQADFSIVPLHGATANKTCADWLFRRSSLDLLHISKLFWVCRQMATATRENYIITFAGTLFALPAALGLLYFFGGPLFAPWMAMTAALPGLVSAFYHASQLKKIESVSALLAADTGTQQTSTKS